MTAAQRTIPFDITFNRHGGNPESNAANLKANPSKANRWAQIYAEALKQRQHGITCREACAVLGVQMNQISGRFTEMAITGQLVRTARVREGCRVWISDVTYILNPTAVQP